MFVYSIIHNRENICIYIQPYMFGWVNFYMIFNDCIIFHMQMYYKWIYSMRKSLKHANKWLMGEPNLFLPYIAIHIINYMCVLYTLYIFFVIHKHMYECVYVYIHTNMHVDIIYMAVLKVVISTCWLIFFFLTFVYFKHFWS